MRSFLTAYTVAVFAFFQADSDSRLIYLGLVAVPFGLALIMFPRAALVVLGALVYSMDWLSEYWAFIPREATWLIDILILILIARTALFMPVRHDKVRAIEGLIYLAIGFAALGALLNGLHLPTILIGLRVGFRYLMLFVVAYHLNVSRRWLRGFVLYLFFIGLIQTPVVITQYYYLGWSDPDSLNGTFGRSQTPGVAIFILTLFCYLAARMIEERRFRMTYVMLIAWMSVCPVFGEVKLYFLLLPVFIVFLVRAEFLKRPAVSLSLVMVGFVMLIVVDYVIVATGGWKEGRNPLSYVTKLHEVFTKEIQDPNPKSERIERSYRFVWALKLAAESPRTILIGNGTGSITHSFFSESHSARAPYYARWGLTSSAASTPWMLTEYGYLGTALFMFILWKIYRRGRILRRSPDIELRIYGRWIEGMTFVYVIWLPYTTAWQSDTMNFIYWPLAGMLVYWSYREQAEQYQAATVERLRELKQPQSSQVQQSVT